MSQKIFRQVALDHLATPEELDKLIQVTDRRGWVALLGLLALVVTGLLWGIFGSIPILAQGNGLLLRQGGIQEVRAGENGQVVQLRVKVGDSVQEGQVLAVVRREAAGATSELRSPSAGVLLELLIEANSLLKTDMLVARLESSTAPLQAIIFVPLDEANRLRVGTRVQLATATARSDTYGYLLGTVNRVGLFPESVESLQLLVKNKELAQSLLADSPAIRLEVNLQADPRTASGFKWSSSSGPNFSLSSGVLCKANLVLGEQRPLSLVLPILRQEER